MRCALWIVMFVWLCVIDWVMSYGVLLFLSCVGVCGDVECVCAVCL